MLPAARHRAHPRPVVGRDRDEAVSGSCPAATVRDVGPGRRLLRSRGHHDSAWSLGFLAAHAVPGLESWDGRTYRRVLTGPEGPVVAAVRAVADGVEVQAPEGVDDQVRRLLALDDDRGAADAALRDDPLLGTLVRARPGLRVPGSTDHLETLVRTVIGQQVSLAAAANLTGRVVREHGAPLVLPAAAPGEVDPDGPPAPTRAFPTAQALAAADPQTLPMPRVRARAVVAVAAAVAADPEVVHDGAALLALPGVGPWTVDYLRVRAGRDPDVLLSSDLAVRRQLERLTGEAVDTRRAAALGAAWAPHRTTAMLHLWAAYLA